LEQVDYGLFEYKINGGKRMKKARKILCILVAAIMLMTVFAACGAAKEEDTAASTTAPAAAATTASETPAVDTSPITLKMYVKYSWWNRKGAVLTDTITGKEITKLTGITLDVTTPPTGDEEQTKLNVMLASGDYPDMMIFDKDATLRKYIETGAILPLDDLIAKNGPDIIKEVTLDYLKIFRKVYAPDDKLYFLPNQYATDASVFQGFGTGLLVRNKVYEDLGKPAIKTTDDLYNVLKSAQAKNYKVNDKGVIPILINGEREIMAGMFGAVYKPDSNGHFTITPDGTVTHMINDPKIKNMLKFVNKLFNEKLIDPEQYTQGEEATEEKFNNARYAFIGHTNAYGVLDLKNPITIKSPAEDTYTMIETPVAPGVDKALMTFYGLTGWNVMTITKNCKTPERAMQLMNFLSSEKGQIMGRIGPEGTVWTMADGNVQITQEYKDKIAKDRNAFNQEVGFDMWNILGNKKYDGAFNALLTDAERAEKDKYAAICTAGAWYLPGADQANIDPKSPEGLSAQKIKEYFDLWYKKLIMTKTDADFEKMYTEMQAQIDKLGVKALEAEETKQVQAIMAASK
jgi:putative aldouronate transport system substrate-binding protein